MKLRKLHYNSDFTNAHTNRMSAIRCHKAGMSAEQIAAEWPLIWKCEGGKLSQRYDSELPDGRLETSRTMAQVDEVIARHGK